MNSPGVVAYDKHRHVETRVFNNRIGTFWTVFKLVVWSKYTNFRVVKLSDYHRIRHVHYEQLPRIKTNRVLPSF